MEDILKQFPNRETFDKYWQKHYIPVVYEDVKGAFEDFFTSVEGHIFLSDYEENGCISQIDFKENLSDEAQFAFQNALTEAFYDKNPKLYETAFEIFTAEEMSSSGQQKNVARTFHETYHQLYDQFVNQLFAERIVK